ncbi:MAG: hypothetical protein IT313_09220 [Anaerolineales bacterium]|nr:hypothetical protein [Anaerolineales bacterium]
MKWNDIRAQYPKKWLLVEALKARTEADQRILLQLAVLGSFADSKTALKKYAQIHRETPERELYVFHSSRERLAVTERKWLGIRGAR